MMTGMEEIRASISTERVAAAMLDPASGMAVNSAADVPMNCLTLVIKVPRYAALTEKVETVRAIGRMASLGKRFAFSEARLVGNAEHLYAPANSMPLLSPRNVPAPR